MDNRVGAVEVARLDLADVADDFAVGHRLGGAERQAFPEIADIEAGHVVPGLLEQAHDDRPDEAEMAGDQDSHYGLPAGAGCGSQSQTFQGALPLSHSAASWSFSRNVSIGCQKPV